MKLAAKLLIAALLVATGLTGCVVIPLGYYGDGYYSHHHRDYYDDGYYYRHRY